MLLRDQGTLGAWRGPRNSRSQKSEVSPRSGGSSSKESLWLEEEGQRRVEHSKSEQKAGSEEEVRSFEPGTLRSLAMETSYKSVLY